MIKGQVSGFQQRFEPHGRINFTVWDFRLERRDDAGQPLPRVAVQMRGVRFDGSVSQGDWVEIDGKWKAGHTVHPSRVRNLTTNATVTAKGPSAIGSVAQLVLGLLVLGVFTVVAITFVRHGVSP